MSSSYKTVEQSHSLYIVFLKMTLYCILSHSFLSFSFRFTYEIAPVFVLMEQLTLKKMREMVGWPNGEGDGLFSPGKLTCLKSST